MQKVLVIVGPTASGKSALAVALAKKLGGEIVSADSRQVYKGLDIGTGKITKREIRGIPHYLLDVADPKKQFSVAEYKTLALESINKILNKNKLPIIVGGTGFYIEALQMDLPNVPPNLKLRQKLAKKSPAELYKMLGKRNIDKHNKVRLIRALEIKHALGKIPKIEQNSDYDFVYIGLKPTDLDKKIYKRLLERVPGMIKEGSKLHKKGLSYKRMEELGLEYRYLARYLKGDMDKTQMTNELYKEIIKYSKRQMTWFKKNKKITWFGSSSDATTQRQVGSLKQALHQ